MISGQNFDKAKVLALRFFFSMLLCGKRETEREREIRKRQREKEMR